MPVLFEGGRWRIALVGLTPRDSIEGTAYKALRRHMMAITHVELPADSSLPLQLRLGDRWKETLPSPASELSPAEFRFYVDESGITLIGGSPKGLLNAVYELIERLGLCWALAGPDMWEEQTPNRLELEPCDEVHEPSFSNITFFQDLRTLREYDDPGLAAVQQQNDRDLINWMGRHRFTGLFGNLPQAPEPWPEATRRGIRRQAGGHILPRLLPRSLFQSRPDLFPMNEDGERFSGNLCVSHPDAVEAVCENARRYVAETNCDVLHLWGEDVIQGKWCVCPDCREISVQDQYLRIVNAVADGLRDEFPALKVAYIAYHDTLSPKITGTPRENVALLFAPRERCYRHGLADPDCERNRDIYGGLLQYRELFSRLHTFEYYGDALLWCSASVVLPRLIVEDMKTYREAGVTDSGCLMFGGYSWFSHPLNLYAFSRASWNLNRSAEEIIEGFTKLLYPGAEAAMQRYYVQLETASRLLVERPDWLYRIPQNDPERARRIWEETEPLEPVWEALTETLNAAIATARPLAGGALVRERQALRFSQGLVRAYRRLLQAEIQPDDALMMLRQAEDEIRRALRILHDLPAMVRGSWGAWGYGEPRRLNTLLQERILPRLAAPVREEEPYQ